MAAINALPHNQIPPQAANNIYPDRQQDGRIAEASKGLFQTVKEGSSRIWRATVIGFQVAGDKISFVVFRILEWIHPTLSPRVENAWLRVTHIWQAIQDAWKQEEIQKEMDLLRIQNHELRVKTRDYDQIVQRNGDLIQERDHLTRAKEVAEGALGFALQQEGAIIKREEVVVLYRDAVVKKNQQLEADNQKLIQERDAAKESLNKFLTGNQNLAPQLAAAQQKIADLSELLPQNQEMKNQLALMLQSLHQVPGLGEKTELDLNLEGLLPKLHGQLDLAFKKLNLAKQVLAVGSAAEVAVSSLERILNGIDEFIKGVPQVFALHARWKNPVNYLLYHTQLTMGV